jgi:hypothetical protein
MAAVKRSVSALLLVLGVSLVIYIGLNRSAMDIRANTQQANRLPARTVNPQDHAFTGDKVHILNPFTQNRTRTLAAKPFQPIMISQKPVEGFDYKAAMKELNEEKVAMDDPRLIALIRNYWLVPPSTEPYNLQNNDMLDYSMGQTPLVDSRLNYIVSI